MLNNQKPQNDDPNIKADSHVLQTNSNQPSSRMSADELESTKEELQRALNEEQQLREALKDERDRINAIVSSMGEGLLVVSSDYNIEMINPAAERLLGVKAQEVVGKPWHEITKAYAGDSEIPFEDRMSVNVLRAGATVVTELDDDHYYLTLSGKKFPVTSVTTPIVKNGQVIGSVKIFRDATKEKEQKELIEETVRKRTSQLKEEKERVNSILENTGEGIVLTNNKGLIDYVNPAFLQISGYSEEDLKGKEFSKVIKFFTLKNKQISADEVSDVANLSGRQSAFKFLIEKKDGRDRIAVLVNAAPVEVEGELRGVVRVIHDFTEDLRLQKQKDDFFSIASHELRTPLTIISGNIDSVLSAYGESNLTEKDKQTLKDSLDASERLIKMVNDFLNVSRLDQGRIKYDIKPLDSCEVIKQVTEEMRPMVENKGLQLNFNCDEDHRDVMADESLLREILVNLVGNSIKFTNEGSITIEQKTEGSIKAIRVIDTGIGIAEESKEKLFHRFQQAMKDALTREAGGTGLGLYISLEFAKAMKGDLVLESSELGKGSTFKLTLPLKSD
ncbi:PAS domain-containing sensor histidine kinase [Candidatus Woesebacteria bacterium]|nr:PAS domain-containing sensor histidine kinase [Candidatus Woesebacteria bacterium]